MFQNLTIRNKLAVGFGVVLVLAAGIGVTSVINLNRLADMTSDLYRHPHVVVTALYQAKAQVIAIHRAMKDVILATDGLQVDAAVSARDRAETEALRALATAKAAALGGTRGIDEATAAILAWRDIQSEVIAAVRTGRSAEAKAINQTRAAHQVETVEAVVAADIDRANAEAERFMANAAATRDRVTVLVVGLMLAGLALSVGAAVLASLSIGRPLGRLRGCMARLSAGDIDVTVPDRQRGDELGDMARAVEVFRENAVEMARLRVEQDEAKSRLDQERRRTMLDLADKLESDVHEVVSAVSASAEQMQGAAKTMAATAQDTAHQAGAAATAATQASGNVNTVAAAAEELSASISEISRQVVLATDLTGNATHRAERTYKVVGSLSEAGSRIGAVVKLINDIAGQTNLLALNATIEAARAGEAGKGFAVVASEVKALAHQTARATGEIAAQIEAVRQATGETVDALDGIADTIRRITEVSTIIASAVEQQSAATREIAGNVQEASVGTREVTSHVGGVRIAAEVTGRSSTEVLCAADGLTGQAAQLRRAIGDFLATIRNS